MDAMARIAVVRMDVVSKNSSIFYVFQMHLISHQMFISINAVLITSFKAKLAHMSKLKLLAQHRILFEMLYKIHLKHHEFINEANT